MFLWELWEGFTMINGIFNGTIHNRIHNAVQKLGLFVVILGTGSFAQDNRTPDPNSKAKELRVMSYNVQNLFDTEDRPETQDEEFMPDGKQQWTRTLIQDKFRNLSKVVRLESPDVLAVSEIENQQILQEWVHSGLRDQGYVTVLAGPSEDSRGITNGIVSRYPVVEWKSHRVWNSSWRREDGRVQTTRDILEVTLDTQVPGLTDSRITVFVNHWPSRAGGPAREFMRIEAGQKLRELMQQRMREYPYRSVVALGDFNDELSDKSITDGLKVSRRFEDLSETALALFATGFERIHLPKEERGTYYFKRESQWNEIDHVVVGQGVALQKPELRGWRYRKGSLKRVDHEFVRAGDKAPLGCEITDRVYAPKGKEAVENRCLYGASDHYPLAARLWVR
jgi:endonuclease/exonuclease/phosphatase family metal-dependent hydrolase